MCGTNYATYIGESASNLAYSDSFIDLNFLNNTKKMSI